jgi:hypothetical protein
MQDRIGESKLTPDIDKPLTHSHHVICALFLPSSSQAPKMDANTTELRRNAANTSRKRNVNDDLKPLLPFSFPHDDSTRPTRILGSTLTRLPSGKTFMTKSQNLSENIPDASAKRSSLFLAPSSQLDSSKRTCLLDPQNSRPVLGSKIPVQKSENRLFKVTSENTGPSVHTPTFSDMRPSSSPPNDDPGSSSSTAMNYSQQPFLAQNNSHQYLYHVSKTPKIEREDHSTSEHKYNFHLAPPFKFYSSDTFPTNIVF